MVCEGVERAELSYWLAWKRIIWKGSAPRIRIDRVPRKFCFALLCRVFIAKNHEVLVESAGSPWYPLRIQHCRLNPKIRHRAGIEVPCRMQSQWPSHGSSCDTLGMLKFAKLEVTMDIMDLMQHDVVTNVVHDVTRLQHDSNIDITMCNLSLRHSPLF